MHLTEYGADLVGEEAADFLIEELIIEQEHDSRQDYRGNPLIDTFDYEYPYSANNANIRCLTTNVN